MPCDSITTQTVALAKAMPELVKSALVAEGFTIQSATAAELVATDRNYNRVTWRAGAGLSITASAETGATAEKMQAAITQAYSRAAVGWAAQRAGWTVTQTAPNKLTLNKR